MATIEELQATIRDPRFSKLDVQAQTQFVSEALGELYGERFSTQAPEQQQAAVQFTLSENLPKGAIETGLSFVPIVAPLTQKYIYGREVRASPLVERVIGEEASREYGALAQVAEDVFLIGASVLIPGAALGRGFIAGRPLIAEATASALAQYGAKTLPRVALAEATIGGIYEVGKLITTPAATPGEAALRLGVGIVGGAAGGVAVEQFIARPIARAVSRRALLREFGSQEALDDLLKRSANIDNVSQDEFQAMLRAAGDRKADWAEELRASATAGINQKLAREESLRQLRVQGELASEATTARLAQQRIDEALAESNLQAQERLAQRAEAAAAAADRRHELNVEYDIQQRARAAGETRESATIDFEDLSDLARLRDETELALRDRTSAAYQKLLALGEEAPPAQLTEQRQIENALNRVARQAAAAENTRQQAVNQSLANLEQGLADTNRSAMTQSEQMLSETLRNPGQAQSGFVGNQPVTLPIGMIQRTPDGDVPVIVDRFVGSNAVVRGRGAVPRASLREAIGDIDQTMLEPLLRREGVLRAPSRSEAIEILQSRVAAEQAVRRADAQRLRPDFNDNPGAQIQEFDLRRGATEQLLGASNRLFSTETASALRAVKPLAGPRSVASLQNIPLPDANDLANAVRGAGFDNVRIATRPDGLSEIIFTRGVSEAESRVAELASREASLRGVFDATTRTIGGLTVDEHSELGRAFGYSKAEIAKFEKFANATLDDMSARGIRVPATQEVLGIPDLTTQVSSRARSAQAIRPEAIVDAERLQRYEVGDTLLLPSGDQPVPASVAAKLWNDTAKQWEYHLQSLAKDTFGADLGIHSEAKLRSSGVIRDVAAPLGIDPASQISRQSPARTLAELVNPGSRVPQARAVEPVRSQIEQGARELGMRVNTDKTGKLTIRRDNVTLQFDNLNDAAAFVNNMRLRSSERQRLMDLNGGVDCL